MINLGESGNPDLYRINLYDFLYNLSMYQKIQNKIRSELR